MSELLKAGISQYRKNDKRCHMEFIDQVYEVYEQFQDDRCHASNGYHDYYHPDWEHEVEEQLDLIRENSPVVLPEDYCELFRAFGGGGIEDKRPDNLIPTMTFWTWDDIQDFDDNVEFFADCPNALPFGDDIGDMIYLLMQDEDGLGIYMADKTDFFEEDDKVKIADSFTQLFTDAEVQRRFRNYYSFGCDKGGDGR